MAHVVLVPGATHCRSTFDVSRLNPAAGLADLVKLVRPRVASKVEPDGEFEQQWLLTARRQQPDELR